MNNILSTSRQYLHLLLAAAFSLAIAGCTPEKRDETPAQTPPAEQTQEQPKISSCGMAPLSANDMAFSLGDFKVTWGELLDYLNRDGLLGKSQAEATPQQETTNGLDDAQQKAAKIALKQLLRRLILLDAARKHSLTVTDEDKEKFNERWSASNPNTSFEDFIKQFPLNKSGKLEMTRDELFLLLKYMARQLDEITVPDAELKQTITNFKAIRKRFEAQMASQIEEFKKYPQKEGFNTDKGFMDLAREYSDGVEADNGGIIDTPMTRKEIAECNDGQPFDTKVGESSALIETETSLRYIRVLEEIPPEQAGGEEKYRIAQILYSKRALDIPDSEDEIVKQLKYKHQNEYTMKQISEILKSTTLQTPIFPNLQKEWPIPQK